MISEWFSSVSGTCCNYLNSPEFILGLSLGAALVLVIVLAIMYWRCKLEHCNAITIEGEHGYFQLTGNAMRNFVEKLVTEFGNLNLQKMKLSQRGNRVAIKLVMSADASIDFAACQEKLRQRLMEEAEAKLGLKDQLDSINIVFSKLELAEQDSAEKNGADKQNETTPAE